MAGQLCEEKSSSGGFCYSDVSSDNHPSTMMQGFVSVSVPVPDPDMFNLTTGMEMIGFSKNTLHANAAMWKTLFPNKPPGTQQHNGPSSSSALYHHHHHNHEDSLTAAPWQDNRLLVDDSSLRCVFPCEGNERPSQGLSLSLSSNNPSSIGLQSFELRQTSHHNQQQQQQQQQAPNLSYEGHFVLKNSKYLLPAQELLSEFCSLGTTSRQSDAAKNKSQKTAKQWEEEDTAIGTASSSKKHALTSLEFVELQKRKTKLLAMLEEVERRYRNYRSQMKAVAASFEAVAGNGAGTVYSAMALKAMSRHCKRLKDGIMGQIQVTRKAMGEKDPVAPGTTRGETPRLKIIDQALRQQRAFQQMSMMETHPWRPQRGLPERSVSVLRAWLFEHFLHPYPSDVDKHILARQTGLSRSQVSNWFINARVRLWKPMVEEMYVEEVKEHENNMMTNTNSSDGGATEPDEDNINFQNPSDPSEDQKPTPDRLLRIMDSECASSSMLLSQDNKSNPQEQHCLGDTFGSVELDFSSYAHHHHHQQQQGVSLTLGLQQHGGVSLAAFPPDHHGSSATAGLFYPITARDHQIEDCDQGSSVQYSLLDGEAQNLPYRNLMGAQLLHDLAG